jgi:sulfur carrier protein
MAKIKLNGKEVQLGSSVRTVLDLIREHKLVPDNVVVEHNLKILPRSKWKDTEIREGDHLEILSFVGGG